MTKKWIGFLKRQEKKCRAGWTDRNSSVISLQSLQLDTVPLLIVYLSFWNANSSRKSLKISDEGTFVVGAYAWKLWICVHIMGANLRKLILRSLSREIRPTFCWLHHSIQLFITDNDFNHLGTHERRHSCTTGQLKLFLYGMAWYV